VDDLMSGIRWLTCETAGVGRQTLSRRTLFADFPTGNLHAVSANLYRASGVVVARPSQMVDLSLRSWRAGGGSAPLGMAAEISADAIALMAHPVQVLHRC
jgi:hypothetical protein